jgi:hypothetical protein
LGIFKEALELFVSFEFVGFTAQYHQFELLYMHRKNSVTLPPTVDASLCAAAAAGMVNKTQELAALAQRFSNLLYAKPEQLSNLAIMLLGDIVKAHYRLVCFRVNVAGKLNMLARRLGPKHLSIIESLSSTLPLALDLRQPKVALKGFLFKAPKGCLKKRFLYSR